MIPRNTERVRFLCNTVPYVSSNVMPFLECTGFTISSFCIFISSTGTEMLKKKKKTLLLPPCCNSFNNTYSAIQLVVLNTVGG